MNLWISHFAFDGHRWCMRFTGPQSAFQEMRDLLKRKPYYFAHWNSRYEWEDGKTGAWIMHGITLGELDFHFNNLEGYCRRTEDRISWFYDCTFWLKGSNKGKGEYKYSLPK